ncbi:MAG: hypothetical protein EAX81_06005 [Candidatus Thorarchaeota archaeon]|nr:hypothetical protein [Candidatus Thorarchaeota archaeon]
MHEDNEEDRIPCEEILLDERRGKLLFNSGHILRHPILFLRILGPLLTAHHPYCTEYEGHVFTFRRRQWCIGCFFNTLSFFTVLGLLVFGWLAASFAMNRFSLFWGAVTLVTISFAMSSLNPTDNKSLKILSKLILGSSFAFMTWAIIIADGFEAYIEIKAAVILSLYLLLVFVMAIRRITQIEKVCKGCKHKMRWSRCPGFKIVLCPLVEQSFLVPEDLEKIHIE